MNTFLASFLIETLLCLEHLIEGVFIHRKKDWLLKSKYLFCNQNTCLSFIYELKESSSLQPILRVFRELFSFFHHIFWTNVYYTHKPSHTHPQTGQNKHFYRLAENAISGSISPPYIYIVYLFGLIALDGCREMGRNSPGPQLYEQVMEKIICFRAAHREEQ